VLPDVHLKVGMPPILRIDGQLRAITSMPALKPDELTDTLLTVLSEKQRQQFAERLELDAAVMFPGKAARQLKHVYRSEERWFALCASYRSRCLHE